MGNKKWRGKEISIYKKYKKNKHKIELKTHRFDPNLGYCSLDGNGNNYYVRERIEGVWCFIPIWLIKKWQKKNIFPTQKQKLERFRIGI